jgi:hypothetical protein
MGSAARTSGHDEAKKQFATTLHRANSSVAVLAGARSGPGRDQGRGAPRGDAVLVNAVARISADLDSAWTVLTGYDRYAGSSPT